MKRWTHFAHHHSIAAPPPMFQPVNGHARLIFLASPPEAMNAKVGVSDTTALHLATATGKHKLVKELPPSRLSSHLLIRCMVKYQTH